MTTSAFYDNLAPYYSLIYYNWNESIQHQAAQLDRIIRDHWGDEIDTILDASCGIGTQVLGLAQRNYTVAASDQSAAAVTLAKQEAEIRGVNISFSVADMRQLHSHHQQQFDVVISCDNSVPHLLTDEDILKAFQQFFSCTRPGGGVILTVRDYDQEERSGTQLKPYGVRVANGKRYVIFQVWEFEEDIYDVSMYFIEDDGKTDCVTHVMRSKYYAISTSKLVYLLKQAGYIQVKRLDGAFFQPVIIGTKPIQQTIAINQRGKADKQHLISPVS